MKKPCLLEGALKWPLSLTVSRVAFRAAARLDSKQLELDGLDGLRRLLDVKLEEAIERIEKKRGSSSQVELSQWTHVAGEGPLDAADGRVEVAFDAKVGHSGSLQDETRRESDVQIRIRRERERERSFVLIRTSLTFCKVSGVTRYTTGLGTAFSASSLLA